MKSLNLKLVLLGLLSFCSFAAAQADEKVCPKQRGTDLVFPKNNEMRIVAYDVKTKTYTINSFKFPGEDASYVTLQALADAVPKVKRMVADLKKVPDDIIDAVYKPVSDVPTLLPKEREARIGCSDK